MALKRVIAPEDYPVDLEEVKQHLRVEHDDDDEMISAFIAAATEFCDGPRGFLGRSLIEQTWDLFLDTFPTNQIEIPLPPLIAVDGVFYKTSADTEIEIPAASYVVDVASEPGRVVLTANGSWPTAAKIANAIRVRFRAGYLDQTASPPVHDVPFMIQAAIKLHVGDLYANRESVVVGDNVNTIPWSAEQLLRPHRFYLGMA